MHTPFINKSLILVVFVLSLLAVARANGQGKIAILPFHAVEVNPSVVRSAEAILEMEIRNAGVWDVVGKSDVLQAAGEETCQRPECAAEIGARLNASRVLLGQLTGLGEKILIYYTLIDVPGGAVLLRDNVTALYVEDLDAVLKRVALSVSQTKPIGRTAEVGNITAEESLEPFRRRSNTLTGLTFGYLYPGHGYDNDDRSFTIDFRVSNELERYEIGLLLAARKGFAVNLFGNYLFTRTDVCPYLGAAFGFHWISHQHEYGYYVEGQGYMEPAKRRSDGFEITANGGIKLFRTYNFQILANYAYLVTFNDYDDRAGVFTLGLVW